jgi:CHAT domain-containing protein
MGDNETALNYYDQAINLAISPQQQLFAQLDQLTLLQAMEDWSSAEELSATIRENIDRLPASHATIYAQIKLSQSLIKLAQQDPSKLPLQNGENRNLYFNNITFSEIDQILIEAVEQARTLRDYRALAYAIGHRGRLYESTASYDSAKDFTLTALKIASTYQYPEIAYQYFWQLGRIEKAQGEIEGAIAAYERSIKTLKSLRSDLVAINSDVQFSFRESVEPIYREFVSLLLADAKKDSQPIDQSKLLLARDTIESLQLAELDNFFQDACVTQKPVNLDEVDPNAAILYTIILPDRLEVIAALHGQPLRHYSTAITQAELETTIQNMREALTSPLLRIRYKQKLWPVAQELYNLLIKPIETDRANKDVKTLVFVLDGSLRNIPMAALYDGEQYLMEKYSVALTPGLQLLDPKPLPRETLTTLTVGLSEGRQGFSPLPNVQLEIEQIQTEVASDVLLNESFTEANLQAKVKSKPFPLVHIATHGEFSSNEEDTFLLTWDNRINPKELEQLLRGENLQKSPIELLVLSACRTAVGDKRAALGLAGVAVRAGARSTLASLWYVSDDATAPLMSQFYRAFVNQDVTKAEALRMAQQKILQDERFSHPYFWSAFVLVGNWL